ncbi:MAG: acyl-CoA dehydrogenase C-terminal domain-containing protein, partial [Burkholderiales bacterium]
LKLLLKRIGATVAEAAAEPECCVQAQHVGDAAKLLGELTLQLGMSMLQSGPDGVLANAALYLDLAGKVVISWMWLRQALVAAKALPNAGSDAGFYRGKLQAARYYIEWELPEIQHQANLLRGKSDVCLTMQDGWF